MSLWEELERYRDVETGLILGKDNGRDNLILNTAIACELLPETDLFRYLPYVNTFFARTEIERGLYFREPGNRGGNSVDNLIGAVAISCRLRLPQAEAIYRYGRAHRWCFNVEEPGVFRLEHWYGRFPGVPPFVALAAGERIGLLSQIALNQSAVWTAVSARGNTSDKRLFWLMSRHCEGQHLLVDRGIRKWRELMRMEYPTGMREVFQIYDGPEHPFAKYGPPDF